jgi:hypothetical protein
MEKTLRVFAVVASEATGSRYESIKKQLTVGWWLRPGVMKPTSRFLAQAISQLRSEALHPNLRAPSTTKKPPMAGRL